MIWGYSPWQMFRALFVEAYVRPFFMWFAQLGLELAMWL